VDERVPDMIRRLRCLATIVLLGLAAGCGAAEPEPPAAQPAPAAAPQVALPDGFAQVDGRDWAIGVPEGFEDTPVTAEERATLTLLSAPEGTAGLPGQVAVARNRTAPGPFDASIEVFKAENRLERSEWEIVSERDVRVPGARLAKRIEATYVQPDGTAVRTIDLFVHSERGVRFDVFVRAPEADFGTLRLAEAIDTFRVA
jgi:hypothetical protein